MSSYCSASFSHPFHGPYHDTEYGFPLREDNALFERLLLEINQAGLSWLTILKKREAFRRAFGGFDVKSVAGYGEADRARLLADAGIVRNRLKVNAAIENARRIVEIEGRDGSFSAWLDRHHPRSKIEWVALFKKTFLFTGGEIVGEFLISTGYLPGAHDPSCPVYRRIALLHPPWMRDMKKHVRDSQSRTLMKPEEILAGHTPEVCALAERLRRLILDTVPDAVETAYPVWHGMGYRHPECGYFCGIFPQKNSVKLGFEYGVLLPDPDGLLEGNGKQVRYLVFKEEKEIRVGTIKKLIQAAIRLPIEKEAKRWMMRPSQGDERGR